MTLSRGHDSETVIGVLLVCFLQQFMEATMGRRRDTVLVSFFERFVVGESFPDRCGQGLDDLACASVEHDESEESLRCTLIRSCSAPDSSMMTKSQ